MSHLFLEIGPRNCAMPAPPKEMASQCRQTWQGLNCGSILTDLFERLFRVWIELIVTYESNSMPIQPSLQHKANFQLHWIICISLLNLLYMSPAASCTFLTKVNLNSGNNQRYGKEEKESTAKLYQNEYSPLLSETHKTPEPANNYRCNV